MAGMWGMRVEDVRNLGNQMQTDSETVRTIATTLDGKLKEDQLWEGPDATSFRGEWDGHYANLIAAADALYDAGGKAIANAEAQQTTSEQA